MAIWASRGIEAIHSHDADAHHAAWACPRRVAHSQMHTAERHHAAQLQSRTGTSEPDAITVIAKPCGSMYAQERGRPASGTSRCSLRALLGASRYTDNPSRNTSGASAPS